MTIEEFIEARLAEDEQVARTAGEGERARWAYLPWSAENGIARATGGEVYLPDTVRPPHGKGSPSYDVQFVTMDHEGLSPSVDPEQGHHIARFDPYRALRQVEATRAIVASHTRDNWFEFDDDTTGSCKACSSYCPECMSLVRWPCGTLRVTARLWADHPDYQESWSA